MNNSMKENEQIVAKIVEGIQERKGKNIVVVNLNKLQEAPCSYFVICEGDSSVHVNAIGNSIKDWVREQIQIKPYATDGFEKTGYPGQVSRRPRPQGLPMALPGCKF